MKYYDPRSQYAVVRLALKQEIKTLVKKIKQSRRGIMTPGEWASLHSNATKCYWAQRDHDLAKTRETVRCLNIVYGLLKGKCYREIEQKVREGREINIYLLTAFAHQYKVSVETTFLDNGQVIPTHGAFIPTPPHNQHPLTISQWKRAIEFKVPLPSKAIEIIEKLDFIHEPQDKHTTYSLQTLLSIYHTNETKRKQFPPPVKVKKGTFIPLPEYEEDPVAPVEKQDADDLLRDMIDTPPDYCKLPEPIKRPVSLATSANGHANGHMKKEKKKLKKKIKKMKKNRDNLLYTELVELGHLESRLSRFIK